MSRIGELKINMRPSRGEAFQGILPVNLILTLNGHRHWPYTSDCPGEVMAIGKAALAGLFGPLWLSEVHFLLSLPK